jgi:hypothetical protein
MSAPGEKSFRVLEYHKSKSVVTVQRAFRAKCKLGVCASRNQVVPLTAEDDLRVRASFLHSSKKSTDTVAKELPMSNTTMWMVLRKLLFSCYKCL